MLYVVCSFVVDEEITIFYNWIRNINILSVQSKFYPQYYLGCENLWLKGGNNYKEGVLENKVLCRKEKQYMDRKHKWIHIITCKLYPRTSENYKRKGLPSFQSNFFILWKAKQFQALNKNPVACMLVHFKLILFKTFYVKDV